MSTGKGILPLGHGMEASRHSRLAIDFGGLPVADLPFHSRPPGARCRRVFFNSFQLVREIGVSGLVSSLRQACSSTRLSKQASYPLASCSVIHPFLFFSFLQSRSRLRSEMGDPGAQDCSFYCSAQNKACSQFFLRLGCLLYIILSGNLHYR